MFILQYFQTTRYRNNENITIAEWMAASKHRTLWNKRSWQALKKKAVSFSKIKQTAHDDVLGLLDKLKMLTLVISYLNQARVYTEEYLNSDSQ